MAKKRSKISIKDILKGKFLVEDDALKHWKFVGYLALLAFVSILSSHWADEKAVEIRRLQVKVSSLKSEYAFIHEQLMRSQMRSRVYDEVKNYGLQNSVIQPYKIVER